MAKILKGEIANIASIRPRPSSPGKGIYANHNAVCRLSFN